MPRSAIPRTPAVIQRVLAIPPKRFDRTIITYLSETETDALLAAPDQSTRTGRRDHAMLATALQTGLRASELISLSVNDVHLGTGAHVSCLGKGRKQRITPLTASTVTVLKNWLQERAGLPAGPLFPARTGTPLSRDALERRLAKHAATAAKACPTLAEKKISPHVMRHTAAMRLLEAGVDTTVIALWLGHEIGRHDPGLHSRRPRAQRTGDRQDRAQRRAARTIPALRRRHRVPRQPVIMPSKHRPHAIVTTSRTQLRGNRATATSTRRPGAGGRAVTSNRP